MLLAAALLAAGALAGCDKRGEAARLAAQAQALWENGHYEDAARGFVTLTEIYPQAPQVEASLYWAANLYQHYLDNPEQAKRFYQQLIVRFPKGRYFYDAKEQLAALYEEDEDTQHRALQIYQQLVLNPALKARQPHFQFRIGRLYLTMGRLDQARMAFRDLLKQHPNSEYVPEAYYLVGYSYYLEQRHRLALAVFRKTARQFPGTELAARAQFFVADTLEEQGDLREALEAFAGLRGAYPNAKVLQRRIKTLEARIRRGVR